MKKVGSDVKKLRTKYERTRRAQTLSSLAVIVCVCAGLAFHTGIGTLSSWGISSIAAICPLGALEITLASRTVSFSGCIGLLIALVLVIALGRAFCAWLCPFPLLRRILGVRNPKERLAHKEEKELRKKQRAAATEHPEDEQQMPTTPDSAEKPAAAIHDESVSTGIADAHVSEYQRLCNASFETEQTEKTAFQIPADARGGLNDSRNWVLVAVLVSTAIFGFPVFCLVCPVGLIFATIVAVSQAFTHGQLSLSLVLFPLLLILEAGFLRRWCHHFCPMGALMSLVSRLNRTFRPTVDGKTCILESEGLECNRCVHVCPEGIDLHRRAISAPLNECIRCKACQSVCPANAISFPVFSKQTALPGAEHVVLAKAHGSSGNAADSAEDHTSNYSACSTGKRGKK